MRRARALHRTAEPPCPETVAGGDLDQLIEPALGAHHVPTTPAAHAEHVQGRACGRAAEPSRSAAARADLADASASLTRDASKAITARSPGSPPVGRRRRRRTRRRGRRRALDSPPPIDERPRRRGHASGMPARAAIRASWSCSWRPIKGAVDLADMRQHLDEQAAGLKAGGAIAGILHRLGECRLGAGEHADRHRSPCPAAAAQRREACPPQSLPAWLPCRTARQAGPDRPPEVGQGSARAIANRSAGRSWLTMPAHASACRNPNAVGSDGSAATS